MLEGLGYVVDMPAATNHALQRLRFNQYHVILLDDDFEGNLRISSQAISRIHYEYSTRDVCSLDRAAF